MYPQEEDPNVRIDEEIERRLFDEPFTFREHDYLMNEPFLNHQMDYKEPDELPISYNFYCLLDGGNRL